MSAPSLRDIWHAAAQRVLELPYDAPHSERVRVVGLEREAYRALVASWAARLTPETPKPEEPIQ